MIMKSIKILIGTVLFLGIMTAESSAILSLTCAATAVGWVIAEDKKTKRYGR